MMSLGRSVSTLMLRRIYLIFIESLPKVSFALISIQLLWVLNIDKLDWLFELWDINLELMVWWFWPTANFEAVEEALDCLGNNVFLGVVIFRDWLKFTLGTARSFLSSDAWSCETCNSWISWIGEIGIVGLILTNSKLEPSVSNLGIFLNLMNFVFFRGEISAFPNL